MAAEDPMVRAHVVVTGRVQGVFFRATAAEEARRLGVTGWVRNVGDEVEAVFEGPESSVEQMVEWSAEGPPRAVVDNVDVSWQQPQGLEEFAVRS